MQTPQPAPSPDPQSARTARQTERQRMTTSPRDLTALLGSRICHDLISPLGAISNGVELLAMSGMGNSPEMALIAESVTNANARIRFFRVAFGAAAEGQMISAREIRDILHGMTAGSRFEVEWLIDEDTPRREAKLALLVIQCFETAMPWGGKVSVLRDGETWTMSGVADRTKIEPDLWEVLSNPMSAHDVSAAQIQFLLAPLSAAEMGRKLTVLTSEQGATFRF
ncbi:MAG: histidine phosphotransferase family protein [Paracoccaceae bacterium]